MAAFPGPGYQAGAWPGATLHWAQARHAIRPLAGWRSGRDDAPELGDGRPGHDMERTSGTTRRCPRPQPDRAASRS